MPLALTSVKDSKISSPKFFYLIERMKECNRQALLDWYTPHDRITMNLGSHAGEDIVGVAGTVDELYILKNSFAIHVPKKDQELKSEQEVSQPTSDYYVYGIYLIPGQDNALMLIKIADDALYPPFTMGDRFMLTEGMIDNYKGDPVVTDVGKFMMNQILLVRAFGDLIPYINGVFKPGKIDDMVAALIMDKKVNRTMFNTYMNNGLWYGQDGSICTQTWSLKSLGTDPAIEKRKKELLEQYKDQLDDPLIMSKVEKELVAMDKAWLKDDASMTFFEVAGGKSFNEIRKKMYIMYGLSVAFDKNTGHYEWTEHSLEEGWRASSMPVMANDIRRGAYSRGIETAKGGEQTKYIMRTFQEVGIEEDDCGTKKGVEVLLTDHNAKYYAERYLVDGTLLTADAMPKYIGKTVRIRSPLHCLTNPGFCYKCCGEKAKKRAVKAIGLDGINFTGKLTQTAMDAMHVSSMQSIEISDISEFLVS